MARDLSASFLFCPWRMRQGQNAVMEACHPAVRLVSWCPRAKKYCLCLVLMMRLWSCGQPLADAWSPQVASEGVVHKSTGGRPDVALRNGTQWAGRGMCRATASPRTARGDDWYGGGFRRDQNAVRGVIGQPVRPPIHRQLAIRILMHPHRRLDEVRILGASFAGEARGRAIGIWASMGAVMGAGGPVLGGWLIDTVGWRSIFLLNIPLAAGAIGLALVFVRDAPKDEKRQPLDIQGGALATVALGALTWGLTIGSGHTGWTRPAVASLLVGFGLLIAFVWVEKARGENAMMPLALFGSSSFIGLTLLTLLLYGALGVLVVLIPYVLIEAGAYSGTAAGAALLPFAGVLALVSPLLGSLSGRIGARAPLSIGSLMVAAGFLLILRIGPDGKYWTSVLPAILLIAFGMAGAVAPLTNAVLASVDARHTASASGLNSAVARTGGLVATALLGSVLGAVGPSLFAGFHSAAALCALASLGAAASAFFLVKNT